MTTHLQTKRLLLRMPRVEDLPLLSQFYEKNKKHFSPWGAFSEPSETHFQQWEREREQETSIRFFFFLNDDPEKIIALCNFTQIVRGAFQACYLGYKIDQEQEGKGLMQEGLTYAIQYLFEERKLHRIMANYVPYNKRSANLLERLGFEVEGYAKNYLLINQAWEDHVLTALSFERYLVKLKPIIKW